MIIAVTTQFRMQHEALVVGHGQRKVLCPACRQLGSTTDCTEQLQHARQPMNSDEATDNEPDQELYAVVSFAIPVNTAWSTLRAEALRLHDSWLEDPQLMQEHLRDVGYEFDLQIHLPSEVPNT